MRQDVVTVCGGSASTRVRRPLLLVRFVVFLYHFSLFFGLHHLHLCRLLVFAGGQHGSEACPSQQITPHLLSQKWLDLRCKQVGQRMCILLTCPHDGQRHNDVTSFKAFPAICLCRFLECDTFFFGTAFKSPSHISSNDGRDGRFNEIAGIERVILGSKGSAKLLV